MAGKKPNRGKKPTETVAYPMRIQARAGSKVEQRYYLKSRLPGTAWPDRKSIAPGVQPAPLEDLMFHGGKTVSQMVFQNIYLGSSKDWAAQDVQLIDSAILLAMQDPRLNNVVAQYFPGKALSCDEIASIVLSDAKPTQIGESDVQAKILALFKAGTIKNQDLDSTIFNLILPAGTVLTLDGDTSTGGLGGYHGSVHSGSGRIAITLYYSANVFSQILPDGTQNGIVAFDAPWKNAVATLYHEINEFRTDADVNDAIHENDNDLLGWMSRQGHECGDQPIFAAGDALNEVFQEVAVSKGGTVPVQFLYSNRVHGAEGPVGTPNPLSTSQASGAPPAPSLPFAATIDKVITAHLQELRKPGALSVRPGYQIAGGWLTKKPAIVVVVDKKRDDLAAADRLPETVGGYAVDVRQAGPLDRLRATDPKRYQLVAANAQEEHQLPVMPFERDLQGNTFEALEANVAAARAPKTQQLPYSAPPGQPLDPVTDTFSILCHVSPDAGWTQLKQYLSQIKANLTVGMYDFTSAHILSTLQASLQKPRTLNLVLDHPTKDRTADQTDEQSHDDLDNSLGNRLKFAWALEGHDPEVSAAIFPSAYHIKVAVRDSAAFWLSSGNWNNSNQPDIDPLTNAAAAQSALRTSDRDWHVIVEHKALSQLFEAYLKNDLAVALAHQGSAPGAANLDADALAAQAVPEVAAQSKTPKQFFPPKQITAEMTIQPVLTPDNYPDVILDLINSATRTLYVQVPYITPSSNADSAVLNGLIAAIAGKIRESLDVRIILSSFEKPASLELLQAAGVDASLVRIQPNLHNKGIIIDSSVVAVGSQNWSPPGVSTNRDATLVIHSAQAAQYWEAVFLHDWANMTEQHLGN